MKKKYLVILLVLVFEFGFGICVDKLLLTNNDIDDGFNDLSQVKHEHMLSMMLEQNAGAGDYSLETRSSWPTKEDGYVFNSTLSKCEKGSKLRWDEENNAVIVQTNVSDKCYVYFDVYVVPSHLSSCNDNTLACWVAKQYNEILGNNNIYYHDSNLTNGAGDNSYRYAGGIYKLTEKAISENFSIICSYDDSTSTDVLINYYCNGEKLTAGSKCYHSNQYFSLQYDSSNTQYTSRDEAEIQAVNDGYLTNNVNNFVCFGSDDETCPDDNLYRIIGVFGDQVKLIKWDYATSILLGTDGDYGETMSYFLEAGVDYCYWRSRGTNTGTQVGAYYWNYANQSATYRATNYYNVWSYSKLNTVNLNTNFLNNIGTIWSNKITETTWKVGGNTYDNIRNTTPANAYTNEITNPDATIESTCKAKVALMYTSDYGFAASPSAWTANLYTYNSWGINNNNWMYMGLDELTVVRDQAEIATVYTVNYAGAVSAAGVRDYSSLRVVRPVFYLNSDVTYVSGDGTKNNPIRIN